MWIIHVISVSFLLCFRARLFIDALWSPAGKGQISWLSFVMCHFSIGILGQAWFLIVLIPDLCPRSYFVMSIQYDTIQYILYSIKHIMMFIAQTNNLHIDVVNNNNVTIPNSQER